MSTVVAYISFDLTIPI